MIVIIKNYKTNEEITKIQLKNHMDLSKTLPIIEEMQKETDVLKISKTGTIKHVGFGLGISHLYQSGPLNCSKDVFKKTDMCEKPEMYLVGEKLDDVKPESIKLIKEDGSLEDTGLQVIVYSYKEGLVLGTGKTYSSGFLGLGEQKQAYFHKNTSKKTISGSIENAKLFYSPSKLLAYIKKTEDIFKYLVSHYNYQYSVDYVTTEYKQDIDNLPINKKTKWDKDMEELNKYLSMINDTPAKTEKYPIPSVINNAEITKESVYRMKNLDLMEEVIQNYENGIIMMSEFAGILYSLDENAEIAIMKAKERGYSPYHIIHTSTNIGELYDVLFVSKDLENWEYERLDKREHIMYVMTYNSSGNFVEEGTIQIEPSNGGIKRIG